MVRLPRTDASEVIVRGEVWNRLAAAVERLSRLTVAPPLQLSVSGSGQRLSVRIPPNEAGVALRFGVLASSWSPDDVTVTLTPCKAWNDATASGDPNINCLIYGATSNQVPPPTLVAEVGDILAYMPLKDDAGPGLLVSPPMLSDGTATYQVVQRASDDDAVWDFVRAHE